MTRRKRGSLTRKEILDTSMRIITNEGIEKLSMRTIAKELKCSVASPYAHFKNQEEIVKELILLGERTLTSNLKKTRINTENENIYEQLTQIAHTYWDFAYENKELHKLMVNMGGTFYRTLFVSLPTSYRVFLEIVKKGIKEGSINMPRNKYPAVARTMWAWIYGIIILEMNDMVKVKPNKDYILEGIEIFKQILS